MVSMQMNWEQAVAIRMMPAIWEYFSMISDNVSQAFGLVGKRVFDGFEVVSCDSDGNGGDRLHAGHKAANRQVMDVTQGDQPISIIKRKPIKMRYETAKNVLLALDCNMGDVLRR